MSLQGLVEVRLCPHGKGLFAIRDIPRDAVIWTFDDVTFTSRPGSPRNRNRALRVGEHEYWDEAREGSSDYWSNFIDHSDDPNAHFVFDRNERKAWFKAKRPIVADEEIFIKYDDYYPTNPVFGWEREKASSRSTLT
jgi:hypothetical protein